MAFDDKPGDGAQAFGGLAEGCDGVEVGDAARSGCGRFREHLRKRN